MPRNILHFIIISMLILLAIPSSAEETASLPFYRGIWSTDRGQMALWQVQGNDQVWGLYGTRGKIGGKISGDDGIFRFTWDEGAEGRGTGWIRLKNTGKTFDGQWLKELDINEHGSWHGDYMGPNDFEVGDQAALNWKPGGDQTTTSTNETEDTVNEPSKPEKPAKPEKPSKEEKTPTKDDTEGNDSYFGDAAKAWVNTWETPRGVIVFVVTEKKVQGSFGDSGALQGEIDGSKLTGTWTGVADDGTTIDGQFFFQLSEDGKQFRGSYNRSSEPHLWLPWSGKIKT